MTEITETKVNKYLYNRIIQGYYAGYWEDVEYPTDKANEKYLLKEYRLMGYPVRCITRRELNPLYQE